MKIPTTHHTPDEENYNFELFERNNKIVSCNLEHGYSVTTTRTKIANDND